jgi:hypothetical protein
LDSGCQAWIITTNKGRHHRHAYRLELLAAGNAQLAHQQLSASIASAAAVIASASCWPWSWSC